MESKSEKKRQHHKIQELGHKLISIPEEIINEMNIGNELIDAISLAKKPVSYTHLTLPTKA